jgi:hypothetical protein
MSYPPPPGQSPYPSAPPPGPAGPPGRLRGRTPLRLALIFGVVGLALAIIGGILIANRFSKTDSFARVSIAERSKAVEFDRVGSYVGYYETPTSASHRAYVQMQIVDSAGTPLVLSTYGRNGSSTSTLTYDYNGRHGEALFTFHIKKSGKYLATVLSTDAAPGADMAFGESIAGGIALGAGLFVPGLLLIVAAIVLLIVGLVKRSRHKKEIASGAYGGGGYGGQYPGQYPGQYGGGQPGQYGGAPGGQYGGGQPPSFPPPGQQGPPQQGPPPQGWSPPQQ